MLNIVFFFQSILESFQPLPHQDSAAIGCTKNYQPIGVTVHSLSEVGEGGVAVNCEKTHFFLNTLYWRRCNIPHAPSCQSVGWLVEFGSCVLTTLYLNTQV